MFKSRMHSVAMLLAVSLTASVSVSTAIAAESKAPAPTVTTEAAQPTVVFDSAEPGFETVDSYICEPAMEEEGVDAAYTPAKPKCR